MRGDQVLASLVPADVRALLHRRELRIPVPVSGSRGGTHRSRRAGPGLEFREHRAYVPGDDIRSLDWRATARSGRPVLRRTETEDELDLLLCVDASGGMNYGEGETRKLERALMLAAALAGIARRQGDAVGVLTGGAGRVDERFALPRRGPECLEALVDRLEEEPKGVCPWPGLLKSAAAALRRRSLVIVLSDFLDPDPGNEEADAALLADLSLLRGRGHTVVLVEVLHPHELDLPFDDGALTRFEDLRGVRSHVEGPPNAMRNTYREALNRHREGLARTCEREGLMLVDVRCDADAGATLLELLARIGGRDLGARA